MNEELDTLERTGILSNIDHSQWALPTAYVKNKSKAIWVSTDFSTVLNAALKDYHYLLLSSEDIFSKVDGGFFF